MPKNLLTAIKDKTKPRKNNTQISPDAIAVRAFFCVCAYMRALSFIIYTNHPLTDLYI